MLLRLINLSPRLIKLLHGNNVHLFSSNEYQYLDHLNYNFDYLVSKDHNCKK